MVPFVNKFPQLGEKETRVIHILEEGGDDYPPPDEYAFAEFYCDEKGCDCRRVMVSVYARGASRIMTTINMGFDVGGEDPGPFLDPLNPQTTHSSRFMEYFLYNINNDPEYLKRLHRHYVMFKEEVEGKPYVGKPFEWPEKVPRIMQDPDPLPPTQPRVLKKAKVGRNQPCPCGSGRKYKKCCMQKSENKQAATRPFGTVKKERRSNPTTDIKDVERVSFTEDDISKARVFVKEVTRRLNQGESDPLGQGTPEALEENPKIAFALLHLLMTSQGAKKGHKNPGGSYGAILVLLEEALTQLRYSVERKRPWAMDAADRIQKEIAERAFQVTVDVRVQTDLLEALYTSKLKLHSIITQKREELASYYGRFTTRKGVPDFKRLFDNLAKNGLKDPFEQYEQLIAELNVLPREGQLYAILEMVKSGNPLICQVALLMLLHPDREIRKGIPAIFDNALIPESVTQEALRRMIGLRNWLPKAERAGLDRIIRTARRARIECAPMPPVQAVEIFATPFDGAGMQGIWGFSRKGRTCQMASVLLKQEQGIRETLINSKVKKTDKKSYLHRITTDQAAAQVEADYLEKLIPHFLWVGQMFDTPPPPRLLEASEILTREYWRPKALDFEKEIAALEDQLPTPYGQDKGVQKVLEESGYWAGTPFGKSWFEDDARVDELVGKNVALPLGNPESLSRTRNLILREILEEKRSAWGERMFWMALRSRCCIARSPLPWPPFLIISRELLRGTPLKQIPLMNTIAEYSILSALRRIKEFPK